VARRIDASTGPRAGSEQLDPGPVGEAVRTRTKQFSETDFNEDLTKIDVPVLVMHGDDDPIVPIDASARPTAQIVRSAELKVYPGASHGLFATHTEQFNRDLLEFIKD
jgi:non-heme chloroperoxidase